VIDFAEKVPEIDPQRIGFWGLSLGGEMALAKAYPDERIKAVIGVCALNNYKTNFTRPIHSIQQKLIRFFMHTSGVKPEKVSDEINKIISPEFNLDSERDYLNARTMLMICTDDPIIGFSEFEKNRKTMKLADDHVLICSKGGHTFGGQELTVTATTLRFFKSIL
jgi:esterase/lipase